MIKAGMKFVVAAVVLGLATTVSAESLQSTQIQGAGGVQIQGNTEINASADTVNTVSSGAQSVATTKIGGISGGTQIQGNTSINASAKSVNTISSGSNSKACTEVGNIGDTAGCK